MRTLTLLLMLTSCALGQSPEPKTTPVETGWTGVSMEIYDIKRIPGDRVLFLIRLRAASSAPVSTLIGTHAQPPPNATPEEITDAENTPVPLSFASAKLTDEATGISYPAVPPDPQGIAYAPSSIMTNLARGAALVIGVEFKLPPVPSEAGLVAKKPAFSLVLPQAKQPFLHLILPETVPIPKP